MAAASHRGPHNSAARVSRHPGNATRLIAAAREAASRTHAQGYRSQTGLVRVHGSSPMFKLYILSRPTRFFGFYPIAEHAVSLHRGDRAHVRPDQLGRRRRLPAAQSVALDRVTAWSACAGERFDEIVGDLVGLLVRDEVAGAGDGDHGRVRALFERAPFSVGDPAVALFRVHDPGWHASTAQPCGGRVVTAEVA